MHPKPRDIVRRQGRPGVVTIFSVNLASAALSRASDTRRGRRSLHVPGARRSVEARAGLYFEPSGPRAPRETWPLANARIMQVLQYVAANTTVSYAARAERHASPPQRNIKSECRGKRPKSTQPSSQTAPLHQQPHQYPCSSDRCLICLTRPDDYEDPARGMTCGMCSACGTFFCGFASASVATPSTRLIHLKRRRMQTPARP